MTVNEKTFVSMTPAEKKAAASMNRKARAKPKQKELPPVFLETSTIYFAKKDTTTRCYYCKQFILAGKAYRVSTDSRHFKHAECPVEQVKQ